MNRAYDVELEALRSEIEEGGARPLIIDNHVDVLLSMSGSTLTQDLLASLSDKAEYDEGMFSIIHAAESLDDEPYVSALLSIFPALSKSAPRWASIVLMRVMNDEASRLALVRLLRDSHALIKEPVRSMCDRINAASPEFLSKTVPVIVAAS